MHRRVAAAAIAVVGCARRRFGRERRPGGAGGSPLNVYVGERGQFQAFRAGRPDGIYYRSTSTTGDAGSSWPCRARPATVYGFDGGAGPHGTTDYTLVSRRARSRAAARRATR